MSTVKTVPAYVIYKMSKLLDQSVSMLDPLGFDQYFETNVFAKAASATDGGLVRNFILEVVSPISTNVVRNLDEVSAMAAARDLNMVASVATRFDIAMHDLPHLENLLLLLSEKTREVPTDTVFGYGTRNPVGKRQRSFTKTEEERIFIESFSRGMTSLVVALAGLEAVQTMELSNPRFAVLVNESSTHLREMARAISTVRKHITPDFFTHRLRPFFEPKTLRGNTYFAAGGAQMPITMLDLLLWGIEDADRTYVGYRSENLRYLPLSHRSKVEGIMSSPSILRGVIGQVGSGFPAQTTQTAIESIASLRELADQIIKFRAPHLGVAKANMRIRPEKAVGSGGYDVFILQYLLDKTKAFKAQLILLEQQLVGGSL